ncbi:MAG TPA: heavy-metal-associated domain-containing protein [Bacteroidota bacterium]|nr:heavy-metal-associated domain-containing protein [Bacteroidota bacterium]
MKEHLIQIEGMSCEHCVMAVRKKLSALSALEIRDVSIGSARVAYDEARLSEEDLRRAIEDAGYAVRA